MHFAWQEYLNAFRNVTRQYRRSLFGISAVAFGVVALILAAGFIEWIFWATREGTIQTGLGHIQVMRPGYLDGGQANPLRYLLPQQSPQMEAIAHFPTVRTLAPRLAFNGLISHGDATISFIGEGVEPESEGQVGRILLIPAGLNLSSGAPKGIILGRGLAENLGVKVGETVVLLANTSTGGINAVECTVRGLFNTASKSYDDSALRVPLPLAQNLLRVSGSHRWILFLDETRHTDQTLIALRKKFHGSGIEFVPWYDLADFYNKMVALLSKQVGVVEFIIAVIIVLSISNTMMMNVLERTAEIGTCLAIGRSRRQILRQFVYEGLTIGLIGGSLGLCLGWFLATVISLIGIPMPPPPGMSQGYSGHILVTGQLALNVFLLAVGTTLLASFYPAWKASRMEIVNALRHNH
ncbi:MAG: FtsX-like permease family protein [Gallionellaceae bacterium]